MLRLLHTLGDWLKTLKPTDPRRQRALAGWELPVSGKLLLNSIFTFLHALPRLPSAQQAASPQHVQLQQLADRVRSECYSCSNMLAALDPTSAHLILSALLNRHAPPSQPDGTEGAPEADDGAQMSTFTLARLSSSQARQTAKLHAPQLLPYYIFSSTLLYTSLNAHQMEPTVVGNATRLAIVLAAETAVLPEAHVKFAKLLLQARALAPSSPVHAGLVAELGSSGAGLLLNKLLLEEPFVLRDEEARKCCTAVLSTSQISSKWVRAMLDKIAQHLTQLAQYLSEQQTQPEARQPMLLDHVGAFHRSVRLLVRTTAPVGAPAAAGDSDADTTPLQYWTATYGHLGVNLDEDAQASS